MTVESMERAYLQRAHRPDYELGPDPLRVADFFSGCGGLALGLAEAGFRADRGVDVRLAVDNDEVAHKVFKQNFPEAEVRPTPVEELVADGVGGTLTAQEERLREDVGDLDVLLAGPPCQGHSDLNNHSRRKDPRNMLYSLMARVAEVLRPSAILLENVPAITHDKGRVVAATALGLKEAGYGVACGVLDLHRLGVPQRRRRHLLIAIHSGLSVAANEVLEALEGIDQSGRTVEWAIEDLLEAEGLTPFDTPSRASAANADRMGWLHDDPDRHDLPNHLRPPCHQADGHTYRSVYGKLWWDRPAQTITTGFTSMGQGRFVHPLRPRTLTPHEAARLQCFPDFFYFGALGRTHWSSMIGNAVPPNLTMEFGRILLDMGLL